MSAAPVYPQRENRPQRATSPATGPRRRRRAVRRRAPRRNVAAVILGHVALFALVASATYGGSTLVGHSLMEHARREGLRAGDRARVARADLARLRSKLERLTTMRAVEDWSKVKGFVPSYQVASAIKPPTKAPAPVAIKKAVPEVGVEMTVARVERHEEVR